MPLTDESLMPFGKHKGLKMIDVPARYLLWLREEGCKHAAVKEYIEDNLEVLKKELNQTK